MERMRSVKKIMAIKKIVTMGLVLIMGLSLSGCTGLNANTEEELRQKILELEREEYEIRKAKEAEVARETERLTDSDGFQKLHNGDPVTVYVISNYGFNDDNELVQHDPIWLTEFQEKIQETYGSEVRTQFFSMGFSSVVWAWLLNHHIGYEEDYEGFDFVFLQSGMVDAQMISSNHFSLFYEALIRNLFEVNDNVAIFSVIESLEVDNETYYEEVYNICDHYGISIIDSREAVPGEGMNQYIADGLLAGISLGEVGGYNGMTEDVQSIKPVNDEVSKLSDYTMSVDVLASEGFNRSDQIISNTFSEGYIVYEISKSYAMLTYLGHEDGGVFDVYLNDEKIRTVDTRLESGYATRTIVIAEDLKGTNRIEIRLAENNDVSGSVKLYSLSTN